MFKILIDLILFFKVRTVRTKTKLPRTLCTEHSQHAFYREVQDAVLTSKPRAPHCSNSPFPLSPQMLSLQQELPGSFRTLVSSLVFSHWHPGSQEGWWEHNGFEEQLRFQNMMAVTQTPLMVKGAAASFLFVCPACYLVSVNIRNKWRPRLHTTPPSERAKPV